jgi:hypothetical protein
VKTNRLDPGAPSKGGISSEFLSQSWYVSLLIGFSFMSERAKMMA